MKMVWGAPERNKGPILEVLRGVLGERGVMLEVSSGSGQHAVFFAEGLPGWVVQPSDVSEENLGSIGEWVREWGEGSGRLRGPLRLDVRAAEWEGVGEVDAIFNANMVHIAPWACAEGLMRGAGRHLRAGGVLVMYGPFKVGGEHTAYSNEAFDADLQSRDPSWGVRDLEQITALAAAAGLCLESRRPMPANNQTLIFRRPG